MNKRSLHTGIALLGVAIGLLSFAPAAWLGVVLERQSHGRFTLAAAEGSIWHGSAVLATRVQESDAVTPVLPGRFDWRLSPLFLLGRVNLRIGNHNALPQPLHLHGSWLQTTLTRGALLLPAEGLAALGAPLNTLAPRGRLRLQWEELQVQTFPLPSLHGSTTLELDDMSSRLSPVAPLGSYRLRMTWQEQMADLTLSTLRGPLRLEGTGRLQNSRLQFAGSADADEDHRQALANLLNLLGQPRRINGKNMIAIEFK